MITTRGINQSWKESIMSTRIVAAALVGTLLGVLGCENAEPLSPNSELLSPNFAAAGNSGCYIVEIQEVYDWAVGHGVLTGDLEGTTLASGFGGMGSTGKVFHETYTADTVVPQLVGKTLRLVSENDIYTFAPGQAPIYRLNGRMRIVDDDVRGNLTSHGTLEWAVGMNITYKGPVCL
jgi:hypothetical protein